MEPFLLIFLMGRKSISVPILLGLCLAVFLVEFCDSVELSVKESHRMLTEINKEKEKHAPEKKAVEKSKQPKVRYIKPLVENFKRSVQGQRLIRQELQKLIDDQCRFSPLRSMKDVSGSLVRFTAGAGEWPGIFGGSVA